MKYFAIPFYLLIFAFSPCFGQDDEGDLGFGAKDPLDKYDKEGPAELTAPKIKKDEHGHDVTNVRFRTGEEQVKLSCRLERGMPTPTVVWTKQKHKDLPSNFKVKYDEEHGISTLYFPRIEPSFHGRYECIAGNFLGEDSHAFDISVY